MRIAGVRVSPPNVRLLAQILEDAGYDDTAQKLADAIRLQALEAPLSVVDYEAILTSLGIYCRLDSRGSAASSSRMTCAGDERGCR
jgi:hypothetical protein